MRIKHTQSIMNSTQLQSALHASKQYLQADSTAYRCCVRVVCDVPVCLPGLAVPIRFVIAPTSAMCTFMGHFSLIHGRTFCTRPIGHGSGAFRAHAVLSPNTRVATVGRKGWHHKKSHSLNKGNGGAYVNRRRNAGLIEAPFRHVLGM